VLCLVYTELFKALEIEFLYVVRRRFQYHLKLVIVLESVGVFAVAAVCGAAARFNIAHVPRLGAETAQKGGGVESTRSDLYIVRLIDYTSFVSPVSLKIQYNVLKIH